MKEYVGLRAKTYNYLKENNGEDKKSKGTKKCVIKRELKFQVYKNCLKSAPIERKINYWKTNNGNELLMQKVLKEIVLNNL